MIEEDIAARFAADAGAIALGVAGRFYPVEAPPDLAPPYVVYRRLDTETFDSYAASVSVHSVPFAIEAHAASYAEACAIGAALKPIFDGWQADHPATLMSMTYAGEHDGAGDYDEAQRRRRSFCRELVFVALIRA